MDAKEKTLDELLKEYAEINHRIMNDTRQPAQERNKAAAKMQQYNLALMELFKR